jgi:uncharacterized membrane protein
MAYRVKFRHRAIEVSRLEAFSDMVFGFALTLIVVSLEVPSTFDELMLAMRGLWGFAICFALLVWIWHCHYTFFRRYNLTDELTIWLNTFLLFVVLFYVYPLKFLFAILTGGIHAADPIRRAQWPSLMYIYGFGFLGIFLMLFLMHVHAYRKREQLELNSVELHDTKTHLILYGSYVGIAILSIVITATVPDHKLMWAGWVYGLIGPVSAVIGAVRGTRRERVEQELLNSGAGFTASAAT